MGYWSTHPMGGDSPLDEKYELDSYLFKEVVKEGILPEDRAKAVEQYNGTVEDNETVRKFGITIIENIINFNDETVLKVNGFIKLFFIFELLSKEDFPLDKDLVEKLRPLADGNGECEDIRGYKDEEDSPNAVMTFIRNNFDSICKGETEMPIDGGLFDAVRKGIDKPGLVNIP